VNRPSIRLLVGLGVEGDAHCGATVKHRSRVARDATQPNLRQVHLIHGELHDELAGAGFAVAPGAMGESVTTRGVALLELPTGIRLHLGDHAIVEITGLRNPCKQLDGLQPGLTAATVERDPQGRGGSGPSCRAEGAGPVAPPRPRRSRPALSRGEVR